MAQKSKHKRQQHKNKKPKKLNKQQVPLWQAAVVVAVSTSV